MTLGEPRSPRVSGCRREQTPRACSRRLFGNAKAPRLLLLGILVACGAAEAHRASPFTLFARSDMRAGLSFQVLDDAAHKESVRQYQCVALWANARRCALPIETGLLAAVVDSTGHVIRLIAQNDSLSRSRYDVHGLLIFRDVVRETRASWDSAGALHRDGMDADTPQLRWLDRTGRWGASLWYSREHRAQVRTSPAAMDSELAMALPDSLTVTDLPAYALFMVRRPAPPPAKPIVEHPVVLAASTPPTADELLLRLRSDLRAVTIAEEAVVHNDGRYEPHLEKLSVTPSPGVRLELVRPTIDGWSAIATHPSLPGVSCVVFAGYVDSPPVTRKQGRRGAAGEVVCDRP